MDKRRRFWVVIPAAGKSARFNGAGPKHELVVEYDGIVDTMLGHVVRCVPLEFDIIVCVREGQATPVLPQVIDRQVIVERVGETRGQAETVMLAINYCLTNGKVSPDDCVMTLDCDTLMLTEDLYSMALRVMTLKSDLVVAVASDPDPGMSRVDSVPYPTLFVEKRDISEWGMVSARAYSRADTLRDALVSYLKDTVNNDVEPYISGALNRYPGNKFAQVVHEWKDWGTPEKLAASGAVIMKEGTK